MNPGSVRGRFEEVDQLATHIFVVRHFCTRDVRQPSVSDHARDVRLWMELNDFDVAPVAGTNGAVIVRRGALNAADPMTRVELLATPTLVDAWIDGDVPLQSNRCVDPTWRGLERAPRLSRCTVPTCEAS